MNQVPHIEKELHLANFSYMSNESLEQVISTLGLSFSAAELRSCCRHYHDRMNRDPKIDELYLLDRLVADAYLQPESVLLTRMETLSDTVAETFADLMMRRSAVYPDRELPVSLPELATVMETYLAGTVARPNPLSDIAVRFTSHRDLALVGDGYAKTAATGSDEKDIAIGVKPERGAFRGGPITAGDYVYAILQSKNDLPDFEAKITEYLTSEVVRNAVKSVRTVKNTALLRVLLTVSNGLHIVPDSLVDHGNYELRDLAVPAFGAIFTAAPAASADMLLLAQDMGLHVILLAKTATGNQTRIPRREGRACVLETAFLRSLVFSRAYGAKVGAPSGKEQDICLSRIGSCTLNEKKHAVVKTDAMGSDPFSASVYGVLYSLMHCVAVGTKPAEMGLACHLTLPPATLSEARLGEALAAILGLYRMQAEFELHGNTPTVEIGSGEYPSLSSAIIAPLPERPIPATAVGGGSKIFYLEPLYSEDGLPDFADLKKLMTYLEKLARDHHVLSAFPTDGDLMASLKKMSRDTTVEYVRKAPLTSRIGGLLVESDVNIQGVLVATTPSPFVAEPFTTEEHETRNEPLPVDQAPASTV